MNIEEIKALSDDELRVKVAEICGWKRVYYGDSYCAWKRGAARGIQVMHDPHLDSDGDTIIPDYSRDLNAIARAESSMNQIQWSRFAVFIGVEMSISDDPLLDDVVALLKATARQRAESFLMAMIGIA